MMSRHSTLLRHKKSMPIVFAHGDVTRPIGPPYLLETFSYLYFNKNIEDYSVKTSENDVQHSNFNI